MGPILPSLLGGFDPLYRYKDGETNGSHVLFVSKVRYMP